MINDDCIIMIYWLKKFIYWFKDFEYYIGREFVY